MKYLLVVLLLMFLVGCSIPEQKRQYIKTERGLMAFTFGYCTLGMLTNNSHDNILDENRNPITCTGYVKLTAKELAQWENKQ